MKNSNTKSIDDIRLYKEWLKHPKYFKKVILSPSACLKMLSHAISGVKKGIESSTNGQPVEIMGLLLGHPSNDKNDLNTLIVTDAFPLPIEGAETKVLADDQEVINYMIQLGELMELTRKDKFMGWYHSHPFDINIYSNCYLSSTDIHTQLLWQNTEDNHGNPWLAIVIDPLRSIYKKKPDIQAFRAYPSNYNPETLKLQTPDGNIHISNNSMEDEKKRFERWGNCWNRYYSLDIEFSNHNKSLINILSKSYVWLTTLCSNSLMENENKEYFIQKILNLKDTINTTKVKEYGDSALVKIGQDYLMDSKDNFNVKNDTDNKNTINESMIQATDLATEICEAQVLETVKKILFS